ncbi:MAG: MoaD/ThiS family protein [Chloroflexota bacterium]
MLQLERRRRAIRCRQRIAYSRARGSDVASVTVTLHGTLNLYLPDKRRMVRVELESPSTAGQLLESLGLPLGLLSMLLVNDRTAEPESSLSDGDLLEAFPFCGGGAE